MDSATLYHTGDHLTTFNQPPEAVAPRVIAHRSEATGGELLVQPEAYCTFRRLRHINDEAQGVQDVFPPQHVSTVVVEETSAVSLSAYDEPRERSLTGAASSAAASEHGLHSPADVLLSEHQHTETQSYFNATSPAHQPLSESQSPGGAPPSGLPGTGDGGEVGTTGRSQFQLSRAMRAGQPSSSQPNRSSSCNDASQMVHAAAQVAMRGDGDGHAPGTADSQAGPSRIRRVRSSEHHGATAQDQPPPPAAVDERASAASDAAMVRAVFQAAFREELSGPLSSL